MTTKLALPLLAALALSACGSEPDEAETGRSMTPEEVADAIDESSMPLPGQYRTSQELLELNVPGMDDSVADRIRATFEQNARQQSGYCLTEDEAGNAREELLESMAASDCEVARFDASGGRIDALMICPTGNSMSGEVEFTGTMDNNGADMVMSFSAEMPGAGDASIRMRIVSNRIGDCT